MKELGDGDRLWGESQIFRYLSVGSACLKSAYHQSYTDLWKLEVEVSEALREVTQWLPWTLLQKLEIPQRRRARGVLWSLR
jgi:hypothetical protein